MCSFNLKKIKHEEEEKTTTNTFFENIHMSQTRNIDTNLPSNPKTTTAASLDFYL